VLDLAHGSPLAVSSQLRQLSYRTPLGVLERPCSVSLNAQRADGYALRTSRADSSNELVIVA
jgi:hypothetical protein